MHQLVSGVEERGQFATIGSPLHILLERAGELERKDVDVDEGEIEEGNFLSSKSASTGRRGTGTVDEHIRLIGCNIRGPVSSVSRHPYFMDCVTVAICMVHRSWIC
jgi:hypothetical protein